MKNLFFIICICCICCSFSSSYGGNSYNAKIWTRVPKYFVHERVYDFLGNNGITNCYEFLETPQTLLLKCWRDKSLTDVSITIETKHTQRYYSSIASI